MQRYLVPTEAEHPEDLLLLVRQPARRPSPAQDLERSVCVARKDDMVEDLGLAGRQLKVYFMLRRRRVQEWRRRGEGRYGAHGRRQM